MWVSNHEPCGLTGPPETTLAISLAKRGISILGVYQQGVHGAADSEPQPLLKRSKPSIRKGSPMLEKIVSGGHVEPN
jgi:hypothetical protein